MASWVLFLFKQGHPTTECSQIRQKCLKWFPLCFRNLLVNLEFSSLRLNILLGGEAGTTTFVNWKLVLSSSAFKNQIKCVYAMYVWRPTDKSQLFLSLHISRSGLSFSNDDVHTESVLYFSRRFFSQHHTVSSWPRSRKIRFLSISKFFVYCCHSDIDFT